MCLTFLTLTTDYLSAILQKAPFHSLTLGKNIEHCNKNTMTNLSLTHMSMLTIDA